jgi:hypothetical protein
VCGGDVEQDDFIGAFAGMAGGELGRVAGIDETDELDAFDNASVTAIKAGNDALGQHGIAHRADAPRERGANAGPLTRFARSG